MLWFSPVAFVQFFAGFFLLVCCSAGCLCHVLLFLKLVFSVVLFPRLVSSNLLFVYLFSFLRVAPFMCLYLLDGSYFSFFLILIYAKFCCKKKKRGIPTL